VASEIHKEKRQGGMEGGEVGGVSTRHLRPVFVSLVCMHPCTLADSSVVSLSFFRSPHASSLSPSLTLSFRFGRYESSTSIHTMASSNSSPSFPTDLQQKQYDQPFSEELLAEERGEEEAAGIVL